MELHVTNVLTDMVLKYDFQVLIFVKLQCIGFIPGNVSMHLKHLEHIFMA